MTTSRGSQRKVHRTAGMCLCAGKVLLLSETKNNKKLIHLLLHIIFSIYSAAQKFGISQICNVFKGVSSAHQRYIY